MTDREMEIEERLAPMRRKKRVDCRVDRGKRDLEKMDKEEVNFLNASTHLFVTMRAVLNRYPASNSCRC